MTEPIADALVLVFTPGMSLREWESRGLLEREWALYERLRPHYPRTVLVTWGGGEDTPIMTRLGPHVGLVSNSARLEPAQYLGSIPARVAELLSDSTSVVVKSNQLTAGPIALDIARALRSGPAPRAVGLVARGGHLHSRFVAHEKGTGSPEAARAGEDEAALCRGADVVVGTTREMLDDLAWRHGLDAAALRLIPNYVLADRETTPATEREPGLVMYCGHLTARKRVDIIIEAVAALPEAMRGGALLRIIGHGPEEPRLRALAAERRIRCEFKGRIPHRELLDEMSRCSVYAQASTLEGHPKTVLEAMSVGAAVLVADSPGLGNVVQNGATGLRVQGEAESFAQSLAALLSDLEWRELLGTAAARVVRANFGLSHIVTLEADAHREALRRGANIRASATPGSNSSHIRWEPDLLNATPTVAADRWMHSLEAFARRLSDSSRAELIARLEASLKNRRGKSAA